MNDWRHTPKRPRLPPAFVCAIAFWVTCASVYASCEDHVNPTCAKASLACACTSLVLVASFFVAARIPAREKRVKATVVQRFLVLLASQRFAISLLATIAAGTSLALGYSAHIAEVGERALADEPRQIDVTLLEDCAEGTFLPRALCRMRVQGGG